MERCCNNLRDISKKRMEGNYNSGVYKNVSINGSHSKDNSISFWKKC